MGDRILSFLQGFLVGSDHQLRTPGPSALRTLCWVPCDLVDGLRSDQRWFLLSEVYHFRSRWVFSSSKLSSSSRSSMYSNSMTDQGIRVSPLQILSRDAFRCQHGSILRHWLRGFTDFE